jgi:hypothetical protein
MYIRMHARNEKKNFLLKKYQQTLAIVLRLY